MKKQDFNFSLPSDLIAQYPLDNRSDSRLLVYQRKTNQYEHQIFKNLVEWLNPGDLLVMNNSRVIPARLYGFKKTGGRVELLVERTLNETNFLSHIKASKSLKTGMLIDLDKGWQIEILDRQGELYHCRCNGSLNQMLEDIGHIPLPPYITREDNAVDLNRYQTVYAQHNGSVAAPTAGLHFDDALLAELQSRGVRIAYVTLHVGSGTFQPVRSEEIADHVMHSERFTISQALCDAVDLAKSSGKRVIAVGTTALRSLESGVVCGKLQPCDQDTNIFITPGYEFKICDGLITNFHLPESTLIMLVCAFLGYENAMNLYHTAIDLRYRFFSYGDACLLL